MIKRVGPAILFLGLALFAPPFGPAEASSAASETVQVGKAAPPFTLSLLGGGSFEFRDAPKGGGAVLLNFWGLRCGACIQEIPHLVKIQKTYSGRVRVIGINVDGVDAGLLKAEMERIGLAIGYEVAPDPDFRIVDLYKMPAAPYTVIIDPKGIVRYLHEDYKPGDEEKIESLIKTILAE